MVFSITKFIYYLRKLFKQGFLCVWIVKAFVSTMYKKQHIEKYLLSHESLSSKVSFLVWVPEKSIMLTKHVYHIQPKIEKTTAPEQ